jgi:hypothetical protein
MARGPCIFRQSDLERALRAAKRVGVPVDIRFDRQTGDLVIQTKGRDDDPPADEPVPPEDIVL